VSRGVRQYLNLPVHVSREHVWTKHLDCCIFCSIDMLGAHEDATSSAAALAVGLRCNVAQVVVPKSN